MGDYPAEMPLSTHWYKVQGEDHVATEIRSVHFKRPKKLLASISLAKCWRRTVNKQRQQNEAKRNKQTNKQKLPKIGQEAYLSGVYKFTFPTRTSCTRNAYLDLINLTWARCTRFDRLAK